MGINIDREHFSEADFQQYGDVLQQSLAVLRQTLDQPGFGQGPITIGAEMEAYITDYDGQVLGLNQTLLDELDDEQLQLELNRFNIEYNLSPVAAAGRPFSSMQAELDGALGRLQEAAKGHEARVVPVGILPTLSAADLDAGAMTDLTRYRVLQNSLSALRGESFEVDIHGKENLQMRCQGVEYEGANTSFQVHLRVEPERYADTFNTLQLVTPLVLAVSANSPILMQRLLWDETRIALFKQSVDHRPTVNGFWHDPARVAFGMGWVRDSAWELFAEAVALYQPIMPVCSGNTPQFIEGGAPDLPELNLHSGTIWPWNRAVYSHHDGGHLRIELRSLPAGPSTIDMVANAAFAIGLTFGLRDQVNDWLPSLPFRYAEYNFYRAAQSGLDAQMVWPHKRKHKLGELPIQRILDAAMPYAREGLKQIGVDDHDIDFYIGQIETRFDDGINPARWQRRALRHFEQSCDREEACRRLFKLYAMEQMSGRPITDWFAFSE